MNLATAEALRSIYVTAAGERNRVARLLGEIAKIALLGEGEDLPELPELPLPRGMVRDPNAPALSSTERSQIRRDRLRKEREERDALARQEVSSSNGAGTDRSDATAMQRPATHATLHATLDATDATEHATAGATGVLPPDPPSPLSSPSLKSLEKEQKGKGGSGGEAGSPATGATADATAEGGDATADATDATPLQRVAVAPPPLQGPGRNVAEAWALGIAHMTGGTALVLARRETARLTTAILEVAHKQGQGGDLRRFAFALGEDFARAAQSAGLRVNEHTFGDWLLAGRVFPERGSGVRKAAPALQPAGRFWGKASGDGGDP